MGRKGGDGGNATNNNTKEGKGSHSKGGGMSLRNVMGDLNVRFIINCPGGELDSLERVFFQVEAAHWFYEDFYRIQYKYLPHLNFKDFAQAFVKSSPTLKGSIGLASDEAVTTAINSFTKYKRKVPVCGCVLLNAHMDKVVLVKGWIAGSNWGFPKGKIDQGEDELECAIREVAEEVGYDARANIRPDDFIELTMRQQKIRLYIARDVPEHFKFETQTRKEIGDIRWFDIEGLSNPGKDGTEGLSFFTAAPFIATLLQWIDENRTGEKRPSSTKKTKSRRRARSNPAVPDTAVEHLERTTREPRQKGKGASRRGSIAATFGANADDGWSIDDMFAVNESKFGVVDTFNMDEYTVPMPDAETQAKALRDYELKNPGKKGRGKGHSRGGSPPLQPQQKKRSSSVDANSMPVAGLAPTVAQMFATFAAQSATPMPQLVLTEDTCTTNAFIMARGEAPISTASCGATLGVEPSGTGFSFNRDAIMSCI
jgi:8-oxo-dGTP pyrophosphatase MutT (NUDIX family)